MGSQKINLLNKGVNMTNKALSIFASRYLVFVPLSIILQSCLGSIAVMLILMQGISLSSVLQMSVVVFTCGIYNGGVLAQLPAKMNFKILLISILISLVLIVVNGAVLL